MKIAITARDFSGKDQSAVNMLADAGHFVIDCSYEDMGSGTSEEDVIRAVGDCDAVIAGLEPFSKKVIEACPCLKLISRRGIGYDSVDLEACRKNNVTLCRTVGAVEGSVAEHIMAYILHFARRLDLQNDSMQHGIWHRTMTPGAKTRKLGLVGFGGIGKEVALRARAFGMDIYYFCRHPEEKWEQEYGAKYLPFEKLLSTCDYISVNVPLTDSTKGLFSFAEFGMMKHNAVFINTSRGAVADPYALRKVLDAGCLRGAGIDVYDKEPCTDSPLMGSEKVILTPHTAPYTSENFITLNVTAAKNTIDFAEGRLDSKYIVL